MDLLFDTCWEYHQRGLEKEFTTGNNDADGPYFLHWVQRRFPERAAHVEAKLRQWGGNSSGINVANIDNLGNVHPDTMWWHYTLGNVRQRPFSATLDTCRIGEQRSSNETRISFEDRRHQRAGERRLGQASSRQPTAASEP